jgi:hypothetical protein
MTTINQDYPEYASADSFVAAQKAPRKVWRDRCVYCGGTGWLDYNDTAQRCAICHASGWVEYEADQPRKL